jgi:hypothetical protein
VLINEGVFTDGMMKGFLIKVLFGKNEEAEVDRLTMQQNTFYRRPFQQSVKLKVFMLAGVLASLVLVLLGRKKVKRAG